MIVGRGSYGDEEIEQKEELEKHLFQCRIEHNFFVGQEIIGFGQHSLIPETVWLLDAGRVIWIWIGKFSTSRSLLQHLQDATVFLYTHPAGRDRDTVITLIKQGEIIDVIIETNKYSINFL